MQFQVIRLPEGLPVRHSDGQPRFFPDGKAAASVAKEMSDIYGVKFQPRPVRDGADWRKREQDRFHAGRYKNIPWAGAAWYIPVPDHFLHISEKDPTKVAFTESPEKGERDIQTQMSAGRYLKRFFPDLPAGVVRQCGTLLGVETLELKIATTEEDIFRVYWNGPRSCMNEDRNETITRRVCAYAAGDLGVAYIEHRKRITARAVCWPEKKVYVSVYGDGARLRDLLEDAGYRQDPNGFRGARIKKVFEPGYGFPVQPYFDFRYGGLKDRGDHLIVE